MATVETQAGELTPGAGSGRRATAEGYPGLGARATGALLGQLRRALPRALWPRIGGGDQYAPRPLTVPASYLQEEPPSPASRISIVTPVGARSRYLERTVDSVLGQRYPELEYIVVHGGCPDGAASILNGNRARVTYVESRPDPGHAGSLNVGFARSSGEIMGWVNSDDLLLPGTLAYVARYFAAHPRADVVYGHSVLLDAHDREVGLWVTPRHRGDALRWLDFLPQETVFWRRRIWDRVGPIDPGLTLAFDWDLFSRFHLSGARIVRLPRFLGGFRQHPEQKSRVLHETALAEQAWIHERWHGRALGREELRARAFPYLLRCMPYSAWYGTRARVSLRRVPVSFGTRPTDGSEKRWSR